MKKISKAKLKKKIDKLCSELIRIRDKNICQHCGKYVEKQNAHCSHVIPKSASNSLRFDLLNLKLLCYRCHINWWHKNPLEAAEWFKNIFPGRWEYLQNKKSEYKKWTIEELQGLIKLYNDSLKELLNG